MTIETVAKVREVIERTHDVKSFRVEPEQKTEYKAGQWFMVKVLSGGEELGKPLSISNSPTESGYLEFTKKLTGSRFSCALQALKPGDQVRIKYPMGNFVYEDAYPKIVFLSGGIGITPIRSILRQIVDQDLGTDVVLLYGNNTLHDIAFRDDFESMRARYRKLKIVHILYHGDDSFPSRTGLISAEVIRDEVADYLERRFYLCGPPAMVEVLKKILLEDLKINPGNLVTENFSGYV